MVAAGLAFNCSRAAFCCAGRARNPPGLDGSTSSLPPTNLACTEILRSRFRRPALARSGQGERRTWLAAGPDFLGSFATATLRAVMAPPVHPRSLMRLPAPAGPVRDGRSSALPPSAARCPLGAGPRVGRTGISREWSPCEGRSASAPLRCGSRPPAYSIRRRRSFVIQPVGRCLDGFVGGQLGGGPSRGPGRSSTCGRFDEAELRRQVRTGSCEEPAGGLVRHGLVVVRGALASGGA